MKYLVSVIRCLFYIPVIIALKRRGFADRFRICDKVGKELKIAGKKLKKTLAKWM